MKIIHNRIKKQKRSSEAELPAARTQKCREGDLIMTTKNSPHSVSPRTRRCGHNPSAVSRSHPPARVHVALAHHGCNVQVHHAGVSCACRARVCGCALCVSVRARRKKFLHTKNHTHSEGKNNPFPRLLCCGNGLFASCYLHLSIEAVLGFDMCQPCIIGVP